MPERMLNGVVRTVAMLYGFNIEWNDFSHVWVITAQEKGFYSKFEWHDAETIDMFFIYLKDYFQKLGAEISNYR